MGLLRFSPAIIFGVAIALIAFLSLGVAFSVLDPTPPRTIVMSTGPEGSAYAEFAEQYRKQLLAHGINLELRSSGGAGENLERLTEPLGDVDVTFVTMGATGSKNASNVESLGAMFFEPLWVFTNDSDLAKGNMATIQEKRISIGPVGSRTNSTTRYLFKLRGIESGLPLFLTLNPVEAAEKLKAGEIDAVFMVTPAATAVVKDLLGSQKVKLASFKQADAYAALFPQIKKLSVPAGVGNLAKHLPPEDVNILAFTTILAVREDLHPGIQSLLLDASTQIHSVPDLFHAEGSFPSSRVFYIPLSSSASQYFTSGKPFLQRFLPFWLSILVMQLLVAALPLIGVIYPALKILPSAYNWTMRRRIFRLYGELRRLEAELVSNASDGSDGNFVEKLNELDRKVSNLKVPVTFSNLVYALRAHIDVVRARLE
jgi:TRAP-type uncharacterized transport system substrate-binding protein